MDEPFCDIGIEIAHRQIDTITQQAAGELATDVSQPDKSNFQHYILPSNL